jgi:hypothetical protein
MFTDDECVLVWLLVSFNVPEEGNFFKSCVVLCGEIAKGPNKYKS